LKEIRLKQLSISNFKGISKLDIQFKDITTLSGMNATGKSSVFDAFTWLLFDKNSKGDSKFELKPLDKNNEYIRGLNPHVTGILEVDGIETKLSKEYKEKWTSRRGESEKVFDGNTTKYEIDDVPVKKSDYNKKINEIADEETFKLLTNPFHFPNLAWKEQRKVILEVAGGDISIEDVIKGDEELKLVKQDLEQEDVSKLIDSKKGSMKKLRENKKSIPYKIEELMETVVDFDVKEVELKISAKESKLKDIDKKISDIANSSKELIAKRDEVMKKISANEKLIEDERQADRKVYDNKIRELQEKIRKEEKELYSCEHKKNEYDYKIKNLTNKFNFLENEASKLREQFSKIQSEKVDFSSIKTECPTCKRPFEESDIEEKQSELEKNFNLDKAKRKKEVIEQGKIKVKEQEDIKEDIENYTVEISDIENNINIKKGNINYLEKQISNLTYTPSETSKEKILKLKRENNKLLDSLGTYETEDNSILLNEKDEINKELKDLYSQLGAVENNKKVNKRIEDLKAEEKQLGVEIARQEGLIMLYEKFITKRVELLEKNINKHFKNVSFKLFSTQVNGAIAETCEATINGVPFSNANTAGQINAGIDIINTLSEYFGLITPIFIDNSECVNKISDTRGQLIKLVVTEDKKLNIDAIEVITEE
jgi:DNA repair exonuclease SbcCD ATPase subunit